MRVLLYGGSFDPPHYGHMNNLRAAAARVRPDRVVVMPAGVSPFKQGTTASGPLRVEMCGCFAALARELGKCYNASVDASGLFGQATVQATVSTNDWLERQQAARATAAPQTEQVIRERIVREDQSSGISFGKVILTVFFLMIIFGGENRRRNSGCGCSGCGCAPFSSILASLGLWKLWGRKR